METIIVDRIENGLVVCESSQGDYRNISLSELPENIKEGSVLVRKSASSSWRVDKQATLARKENVTQLMDMLFK